MILPNITTLKLTNNILYFTIANYGYTPLVKSFAKRLAILNFKFKLLVICTDSEALNILKDVPNVECILYKTFLTKEFVGWKDKFYIDLVFVKFDITKEILQYALENNIQRVVYTDTDIWIYKNFEEDLLNLVQNTKKYCDIIMQDGEDYTEQLEPVSYTFTENTINQDRLCKRLCTGFMIINPTMGNISLFDYKNYTKVNWQKYVGNQPYLNDVIKTEKIPVLSLGRQMAINGSLFKLSDSNKYISPENWLLHYTYLVHKDKLIKMKENHHWVD